MFCLRGGERFPLSLSIQISSKHCPDISWPIRVFQLRIYAHIRHCRHFKDMITLHISEKLFDGWHMTVLLIAKPSYVVCVEVKMGWKSPDRANTEFSRLLINTLDKNKIGIKKYTKLETAQLLCSQPRWDLVGEDSSEESAKLIRNSWWSSGSSASSSSLSEVALAGPGGSG